MRWVILAAHAFLACAAWYGHYSFGKEANKSREQRDWASMRQERLLSGVWLASALTLLAITIGDLK